MRKQIYNLYRLKMQEQLTKSGILLTNISQKLAF